MKLSRFFAWKTNTLAHSLVGVCTIVSYGGSNSHQEEPCFHTNNMVEDGVDMTL